MRFLTMLSDELIRIFRVATWKWRGRKLYVCHVAHENDRAYTQTLVAYSKWAGVDIEVIEFNPSGQRPELQRCLDDKTIAVIGYNSQLDHSWIGDKKFIAMAADRRIPVIQWILDHPSLRWPQFDLNLDAPNVRYGLVSHYCEQYFHRYAVPGARTSVASCTANPLSRVDDMSRDSFLARDIACIIPLNLRRIGGTAEELETRIRELEPRVADAVRDAIERARFDLDNRRSWPPTPLRPSGRLRNGPIRRRP
jgi:hypothetical protein